MVQNAIILHDNARSHTAAAVTDLLRRWKWEILEHPPYSPDMSPCDYDLNAEVKEPLLGTRYNTDELISATGRSIWNINNDGRADGVRRLPNIWQKIMINKRGEIMLKAHKCCTLVKHTSLTSKTTERMLHDDDGLPLLNRLYLYSRFKSPATSPISGPELLYTEGLLASDGCFSLRL